MDQTPKNHRDENPHSQKRKTLVIYLNSEGFSFDLEGSGGIGSKSGWEGCLSCLARLRANEPNDFKCSKIIPQAWLGFISGPQFRWQTLIYLAFHQPPLNLPASWPSVSTVGAANCPPPVSRTFPNHNTLFELSKYHFSVNCADFFFLFISFLFYLLAFFRHL